MRIPCGFILARRRISRNTAMPPSPPPPATTPSPVRKWPGYSERACKHKKDLSPVSVSSNAVRRKVFFCVVCSVRNNYSFSMSSIDIPVTFAMVSNGSPKTFIALAFFIFSSSAPFLIPFSSAVSRTFFMSR